MTNTSNAQQATEIADIKAALETLNDPLVHNQSLIDCRNLLNLSLDTLLNHFQIWLWKPDGEAYADGGAEAYAIELGKIEEALVLKGLIYDL